MTYAFTFDASACSGCKACQVACKDKNNLPGGVLWRRVYEVSGGSWRKQNEAWTTDVFAYNLSIACNHCVHPKCAGVCPVDAYVVRPDGIVYIDETKCMGCGYCAWACPYSAPRYNPELGHMTKCNFCFDNLDAGLPPACVAACPMRVLDFVEVTGNELGESSNQKLWDMPGQEHPFPLPTFSRTQPHLAIEPHAGMGNGLEKTVSNWEEIKTTHSKAWRLWSPKSPDFGLDELPLIIFTLCGQLAVGMWWIWLILREVIQNEQWNAKSDLLYARIDHVPVTQIIGPLYIATGVLLAVGMLFSFLHLGTKRNAWRALKHLKKSSLSREILFAGLFMGFLVAKPLASLLHVLIASGFDATLFVIWANTNDLIELAIFLSSIGLVYYMSQVYRIKSVPAWNTWRTPVSFFLSAGVLGALAGSLVAGHVYNVTWLAFGAGILLAAEAALMLSEQNPHHETARKVRGSLIVLGMIGVAGWLLAPRSLAGSALIFLIVLVEELIGRWLFYMRLEERAL